MPKNDPPILLWHSYAPWTAWSYGRQTAYMVPRIAALGYQVIISAFSGYQGPPMLWEGFTVLPGYASRYGDDVLPHYYRKTDADLAITLLDLWAMDPATFSGMNVAHWMPIDSFSAVRGIDQLNLQSLANITNPKPITFTRFGEEKLTKAGFAPYYVPHGIDTKLFRPASAGLRKKIRSQLGTDDYFVIGINAANADPIRKGFTEQILAFAELRKRHRDCVLLLNTAEAVEGALHLPTLIRECGELANHPGDLRDWVWLSDQFKVVAQAIPDKEMARWTQGLDVLSMCSYGEGFGLTALEAQACSVSVVTTDAQPMKELCPYAYRVSCEPFWHYRYQSWWYRPSVAGILTAYESAWQAREDGTQKRMAQGSREWALNFDADLVVKKYWAPVLQQLVT